MRKKKYLILRRKTQEGKSIKTITFKNVIFILIVSTVMDFVNFHIAKCKTYINRNKNKTKNIYSTIFFNKVWKVYGISTLINNLNMEIQFRGNSNTSNL